MRIHFNPANVSLFIITVIIIIIIISSKKNFVQQELESITESIISRIS